MAFDTFGTLIGRYLSSLPTLTTGDFSVLSLDSNGKAWVTAEDLDIRVLDANNDNVAISDGTYTLGILSDGSINVSNLGTFAVQEDGDALDALQLIDDIIFVDGAAWNAGNKGAEILAVRKDTDGALTGVADGEYSPLQVDADGKLKVAGTFAVNVDDTFESGTEADACSDSAGDGIVAITNSMTDVVTIAVTTGTYYIVGVDIACDKPAAYELIIDDNGTPTQWIRAGVLAAGSPDITKNFNRAIEIVGQADRSIKIRVQVTQGTTGQASAAINGYTR